LQPEDVVALRDCIDYYLGEDGRDFSLAKSLMNIVVEKSLSGNSDFKSFFMQFFTYSISDKQFKRWGAKVLGGEKGYAELARPFFNSDGGSCRGDELFKKIIKSASEGDKECKKAMGYALTNRDNRPDDHSIVVFIPPLKHSKHRRESLSCIMNHPWSV
jgi:hypothetical protein